MNAMPYDAGNAGDLIKHEWLLRALAWLPTGWVFFDPFAGRPSYDVTEAVRSRLLRAPGGLLLKEAQSQALAAGRYLGSSGLAAKWFAAKGLGVGRVHCFDRDEGRLNNLRSSGFSTIDTLSGDGYSILDDPQKLPGAGLLLLDPFNLLGDQLADDAFWQKLAAWPWAALVFVLNLDPDNDKGRNYGKRLEELRRAWPLLHCVIAPLRGSNVEGESKYHVEMLYLPEINVTADELSRREAELTTGARAVADTLGLTFSDAPSLGHRLGHVEFYGVSTAAP